MSRLPPPTVGKKNFGGTGEDPQVGGALSATEKGESRHTGPILHPAGATATRGGPRCIAEQYSKIRLYLGGGPGENRRGGGEAMAPQRKLPLAPPPPPPHFATTGNKASL